jgi:hypothetical protein
LLCPTFSNFKIEWRHLSQVFLILRFPETNRTFRYIEAAKMSQKNRPLRLSGTAPHLLSQKNWLSLPSGTDVPFLCAFSKRWDSILNTRLCKRAYTHIRQNV